MLDLWTTSPVLIHDGFKRRQVMGLSSSNKYLFVFNEIMKQYCGLLTQQLFAIAVPL